MERYICVDPTPAPVTTEAPGGCYWDSYKASGKCLVASEEDKCLSNCKDCKWMETDTPEDCELTTTASATTGQEAGCCKGDKDKICYRWRARQCSVLCDVLSAYSIRTPSLHILAQ